MGPNCVYIIWVTVTIADGTADLLTVDGCAESIATESLVVVFCTNISK